MVEASIDPGYTRQGETDMAARTVFDSSQFTLRHYASNVWTIAFCGDLTHFANQEVDALYQHLPHAYPALILDFSRCEYINTTGLALLINLVNRSQGQGQRLLAYGLQEHYRKLFHMVGLENYVEVCTSRADALSKAIALIQLKNV